MHPPSRFEIEQFANDIFRTGLELRSEEAAQKQARALAVAESSNRGAYLPALIECMQERLRAEILTLAEAWVQSGRVHGVPLPRWAEESFEKAALLMAAGTNSALRGELDLRSKRKQRTPDTLGVAAGSRAISLAMNTAVREGCLRIKRQRIDAQRSMRDAPASIPARPPETGTPFEKAAFDAGGVVRPSDLLPTPEGRKRGRPRKYSDELKEHAQAAKESGGNRAAAIVLYATKRPTLQQVKSVSTILREHRKKNLKQPAPSIQSAQKAP